MFHHISNIENIAVVIVITKNNDRANHYFSISMMLVIHHKITRKASRDELHALPR